MNSTGSTLAKVSIVLCVLTALLAMSWLSPSTSPISFAAGFTPGPEPTKKPTKPPTEEPTKPPPTSDHGGDKDGDHQLGAIRGNVIDLCYGQPARGVQVSINGVIVTTDSQGTYSLTGLPAGEYTVTVVVDSSWQPSSQTVHLDAGQTAVVDLTFVTFGPCGQPQTVPTEAVAFLPETGAAQPLSASPGFLALGAFVLVVLGFAVWAKGKRT